MNAIIDNNKDFLNFIKNNSFGVNFNNFTNSNDILNEINNVNVMVYGSKIDKSYLTTFDQLNPLTIAITKKNEKILECLLNICKLLELNLNGHKRYKDSLLYHAISSNNSKILLKVLSYPNLRIDIFDEDDYNTALHHYCRKFKSPEDCQEIINIMIERTNDLNRINGKGKTPLHKAILNNSIRLMLVHTLIENGARLNVFNYNDYTPLHCAIKLGRSDVILKLLKNGADLSLQKNSSPSSYQLAIQLDSPNVIKLINNYLNLSSFLDKHLLSNYLLQFLKRDILYSNLNDLNEETLIEMGLQKDKILLILK
ncbi:hypothetical protein DDB_G0282487 [Dictyostelium discoideum AX4]|uniref:Uncharacterized protein n=1 Tax=Dictyostelium discoideum TaxID=44689 RepID=Q54SG0_DICDI|nr:hypothetical protein DDB_G0282487 [Dictyostelium discoideum AX4]EAL66103.1 hypothetical protein DDB_G0282487 [Dictyostelium discoideum AX4]|eukprot:XP_640079.1 hypothetical protein DDB_G0282487 [Dictyostelium discoideum AX4]